MPQKCKSSCHFENSALESDIGRRVVCVVDSRNDCVWRRCIGMLWHTALGHWTARLHRRTEAVLVVNSFSNRRCSSPQTTDCTFDAWQPSAPSVLSNAAAISTLICNTSHPRWASSLCTVAVDSLAIRTCSSEHRWTRCHLCALSAVRVEVLPGA